MSRGAAPRAKPAKGPPRIGGSLLRLAIAVAAGYSILALGLGYWQVVQSQSLSDDPRNPLVVQASRSAPRGQILTADGEVLARNSGSGANAMRVYPYPDFAPVLGYKSLIFGTAGLERTYDQQLIGLRTLSPGDDFFAKFRGDRYDPADLVTSLNVGLQQAAVDALGNDKGAVVAIEPSTGRILAMVSSPTFDPNRIADPAKAKAYLDKLQQSTDSPLLNRATQGQYVPGSVFKIVTATAGIGSGAITPQTTFLNQPAEYQTGFLIEGFRVRDARRPFQTDHPLDFFEATEVSSNIWYAHAGLQIGAQNMLTWAARLGFGAPIPFDLATSSSQLTSGGGPLYGFTDQVELANASYGQGETLVTPLQMALVASTIANNGVEMKPTLVDELRAQSGVVTTIGPQVLSNVLPSDRDAIIKQAMIQAVEGQYGASFAGGARVPGVTVAGKSGSAQLGDGGLPHSWFIGFAPAENPTIAIAVIVERAGSGAGRAVPMAGQLLAEFLGP